MSRATLGVGLWVLVGLSAVNCGGNTRDDGAGPTPGTGAGGRAGQAGEAGGAGASGNAGTAGLGGIGSLLGGSSGSGGRSSFSFCTASSQCVLRPQSCCGRCGAAVRGDAIAISLSSIDAYAAEVCQGGGCPDCFGPSDPTLFARCEGGSCTIVDLSALPLTECSSNLDCKLRTRACCECGGDVSADSLIAIRKDAELQFQQLTCEGIVGRDACAPVFPSLARAACRDGRCTVTTTSGTTPI